MLQIDVDKSDAVLFLSYSAYSLQVLALHSLETRK